MRNRHRSKLNRVTENVVRAQPVGAGMQRQVSPLQGATIPLLETESLTRALFVSRLNRFVVRFRRGTCFGRACLANSGRLWEVLLPGTELSFAYGVKRSRLWPWTTNFIHHKTAIFRQVNVGQMTHHDALEFPDGEVRLLTSLSLGQEATVLQLPAGRLPADVTQKQAPVSIIA